MPETDGAPVDVRLRGVQTEQSHVGHGDAAECFVDFEHRDVFLLYSRLGVDLGHGERGGDGEVYRLRGGVRKR